MKAYIKKITYSLPEYVEKNLENRLTKKIGIYSRHVCKENEIASDFAIKAAEKLFHIGVDRNKIDMLLYCTQSPDYPLPTTACILQDRLKLPKSCGSLDYNLGCSGYIYGLSLAKGLIESEQVRNVLLITSETYSKYINKKDNSVKSLFGDGATATLVEAVDTDANGLEGFVLGTDGSGYQDLIVPVGGMVHPYEFTDMVEEIDEYGNIRTNRNLYMNGSSISEFALEVVPDTIGEILKKTNKTKDDIGYFIFHQANKFMLNYLRMKCDLMQYPYWNDVKKYGNTVSSSIPLAIHDMIHVATPKNSIIMAIGFGVGLSWGGCLIDTSMMEK
ncbi:3-oxoacyl-ACP synthase III family protein [Pectinatus frisingensis]|uniref:3-oxoacyl-ACP synthase III family protein n=1 Tax=Pectinatus frisingensis TaxID=865 RepID=UPI001E5084FD|nr:ketoacyl-ACP synthase III [Pectinatus frisingensis]